MSARLSHYLSLSVSGMLITNYHGSSKMQVFILDLHNNGARQTDELRSTQCNNLIVIIERFVCFIAVDHDKPNRFHFATKESITPKIVV